MTAEKSSVLFVTSLHLGLRDEFLKMRIVAERIKHRIEMEQHGSKQYVSRKCAKAGLKKGTGATSFRCIGGNFCPALRANSE